MVASCPPHGPPSPSANPTPAEHGQLRPTRPRETA
ncbi:BZ3500_MvSof-1268-A1-R1_C040g00078 [Microbotryum saponariae]|uniref:BZ3500_MvSof-1268-A1-R1_C040g00078 protein n=1 Tax=Microbotryum saponariae TaxID=289078 RepID=A0A2X0L971_9BASI|nr:BZ3500_MvSof-1268-A1-R1_C040g00078 [Microbotryum saponariae]